MIHGPLGRRSGLSPCSTTAHSARRGDHRALPFLANPLDVKFNVRASLQLLEKRLEYLIFFALQQVLLNLALHR